VSIQPMRADVVLAPDALHRHDPSDMVHFQWFSGLVPRLPVPHHVPSTPPEVSNPCSTSSLAPRLDRSREGSRGALPEEAGHIDFA
jgi:hypothetical protein